MNRHIALYERVSTDRQAKEGVSLEAQTANLRRTAKAAHPGLRTKDYTDEGFSGREGKTRPQLDALRAAIEAGQVEHVYATKIDRLARSVSDLIAFLRLCAAHNTGVTTIQLGELMNSATGKLLRNVMASIAEFESDLRSERILEVNEHLRAEGRFVGKPPWGYMRQGRDLVHGPDAWIILRLFELFAEGWTKAKLVRWANDQPREQRITPLRQDNMHRILSNPVYAGFIVTDTKSIEPVVTPGSHRPIVPVELFERVQALLITRKGHGYHGDRVLPYAGLTRCGECGKPLRHSSDGEGRHYIGCSAFCGLEAWPAPYFELFVIAHIDVVGAWIDHALADGSWREGMNRQQEPATPILDALKKARESRDRLIGLVRRDLISEADATRELVEAKTSILELEQAYAHASQTDVEAEAELRSYRADFPAEDFRAWWVETPDEERERVLPKIVSRIWLANGSIGFLPTRAFRGPIFFETNRQRQRSNVVAQLAEGGFLGIRRSHDKEPATKLRSLARARSAGRNRIPPCAARPARG